MTKHTFKTIRATFAVLAVLVLSACSTAMPMPMSMEGKAATGTSMCKKDGGGCCSGMKDNPCCKGM